MSQSTREPDKWERDRVAWNLPRPKGSQSVERKEESLTKPGAATAQKSLKLPEKH